jgi:hypothetical protein
MIRSAEVIFPTLSRARREVFCFDSGCAAREHPRTQFLASSCVLAIDSCSGVTGPRCEVQAPGLEPLHQVVSWVHLLAFWFFFLEQVLMLAEIHPRAIKLLMFCRSRPCTWVVGSMARVFWVLIIFLWWVLSHAHKLFGEMCMRHWVTLFDWFWLSKSHTWLCLSWLVFLLLRGCLTRFRWLIASL